MTAIEPLKIADPLGLPGLESELVHRWLVWDAWTAGRRRVDLHPFVLSQSAHHEAIAVAERAWSLVKDAGELGEAAHYRLHPDIERLAAAARAAGDRSTVARVDLLLRDDGHWIACEVNADCPGGYNEAIALPKLARSAGAVHREPANAASQLADRLVARANGGVIALAYATGYAEDLQVCALLERMIRERGGRTMRIAPTMLSACGEGVGVRSEPVAVLYRFYPLEYMVGQKNLDAIERATANGALASISSFASIHAQSKLAMARAFVHTEAEAARAFPDTFAFADIDRLQLMGERSQWVIKRALSRVGDHVYVGALTMPQEWSDILDEVAAMDHAKDQAWIAQRFVPQQALPTPWGDRLVTLGVYLLDGDFAGYYARFSLTSHCSHDALVLPVFVSADP